MADKHTSGSWELIEDGYNVRVENATGIVCDIYLPDGDHPLDAEEASMMIADARLCSVSPELLEALEAMVELYDSDEGCRQLAQYQVARSVIAKARGDQ